MVTGDFNLAIRPIPSSRSGNLGVLLMVLKEISFFPRISKIFGNKSMLQSILNAFSLSLILKSANLS